VKPVDISGTREKEYPKTKIDEVESKRKLKNIRDSYRDISDFKKCYQPRTNIVKDEKGDLFTYSHGILAKWRNDFSQLLNVHVLRMLGRQKYSYIQHSH
jgi:hypothetical protein